MNNIEDTLEKRINIDNYSTFEKLLRVTARVLTMYQKTPRTTFKNVTKVLTPEDITNAEQFWILQAQKIMHEDLKKGYIKASVLENVTTEYIQWEDVVNDGWK